MIGLALGTAFYLPRTTWRQVGREVWAQRGPLALVVLLANLPDIDYLPGLLVGELNRYHHLYTHTLGWVVATVGPAWWWWKRRHPDADGRTLLVFLAAGLSHLAADFVTTDRRPPLGIMALWPFSSEFYLSATPLFWPLRKATVADMFQLHNVQAVLVEAAWCLPLLALVLAWKLRRRADVATVHP